jgi:hypothetical protein
VVKQAWMRLKALLNRRELDRDFGRHVSGNLSSNDVPMRSGAYSKRNWTVTVILLAIGWPFSRPGEYFHCLNASRAAR